MAAARSAATASERDIIPGCGYKSYGAYEPEEPRSLDSLPKRIQARLVSHLTARLGTIVFARLQMTGGQIVDLHRLYKVEPKAREYEWVIPTYLLHFEIDFGQDPDEHFCAEISLDADGTVIEDISLPRTADNPQKIAIISKVQALEAAATHDVPVDRASVQLAYAPAFDTLEWLVSFPTGPMLSVSHGSVLHLNAADPAKYRWSEYVVRP